VLKYKSEIINQNGLSNEANITIEITEVEFLGTIKYLGSIAIRVTMDDKVWISKPISAVAQKLSWNEKTAL